MSHDAAPRVCIVTPFAIGSNPRVVKEADALTAAGYRVSVISTRMLARVDARDEALLRRVAWTAQRINLTSRWRWRRLRALQAAARLCYFASRAPALASPAFSPVASALAAAALRTPADLYIAHYPSALRAAAEAAACHQAAYAFDAEDFHLGEGRDDPRDERNRALVRAIEGVHLPGCAFITAAAPAIAEAYAGAYRIARPTAVLNCFPLANGPGGASPRGWVEPGPSLYWFSQTIGPDRGLECAVRALGLARSRPHLYLRGAPVAGYGERLRELAAQVQALERVHLLPPAPPDEMERLAAPYDLALCGEPGCTENNRRALSNKLFSYLVAGVPPLMSATPAQGAFAAQAGVSDWLYPVDDAATLALKLDALLSAPDSLAKARARAFALARRRYNWEVEQKPWLALVERAIEPATFERRDPVMASPPQSR